MLPIGRILAKQGRCYGRLLAAHLRSSCRALKSELLLCRRHFFAAARASLLLAGVFKPRDATPVHTMRRVSQARVCSSEDIKMEEPALRSDVARFLNRLLVRFLFVVLFCCFFPCQFVSGFCAYILIVFCARACLLCPTAPGRHVWCVLARACCDGLCLLPVMSLTYCPYLSICGCSLDLNVYIMHMCLYSVNASQPSAVADAG